MTRFLFFVAGLSFLLMMAVPLQAQPPAEEWQTVRFGDETETPVINQLAVDGAALWVAAHDGLWRFDGRNALRWDTDESNHILSLLIDKEDRLWIGTTLGLIVLNADRDWSERIEPLPQLREPIWVIRPALDGGVWLGSDNGLHYAALPGDVAASSESTALIALADEAVQALARTPSGDLWIGTRDRGLFFLQQAEAGRPQITEIGPEVGSRINALFLGQEGELWAGTEENGLCMLPGDASSAICSPPPFDEIEQPTITGLFADSSTPGAFWIATPDRLWHYAPPANLIAADLRPTDVRTIVEDGEGQQWAGSTSGLLHRRSRAWEPLLADLERDKQDVRAILEDDQGVLIEEGEYIASRIPDARLVRLPGADHFFWAGDTELMLQEIEEFVTGTRGSAEPQRVVATALFTDIVGSTRLWEADPDAMTSALDRHEAIIRSAVAAGGGEALERHRLPVRHGGGDALQGKGGGIDAGEFRRADQRDRSTSHHRRL